VTPPGERPLVLCTVGTDFHPFDRLIQWLGSWQPAADEVDILVQSGTSRPVPGLRCRSYMTVEEMDAAIAVAVAVVCHGGPATIMQARHAGLVPLVVPRRPELGEHVDGHQLRFTSWMAKRAQVVCVESEVELHTALDKAVASPPERFAATDAAVREVSERFGALVDGVAPYRPR
jgi:UDP-N-acetylglucosamine transferase subunit ALG13